MKILLNSEPILLKKVKLNFFASLYNDNSLAVICETINAAPFATISINLRSYGVNLDDTTIALNHDLSEELRDLVIDTFAETQKPIQYGYAHSTLIKLKEKYAERIQQNFFHTPADKVLLTYIGHDFWSYPVYQVEESNHYVKDISGGASVPNLYWCCPIDDPDGEPERPFEFSPNEYEIFHPTKKITREDKKLILATMIAANQYKEGINSIEWVDYASSIHDIELTKQLLKELKEHPMELVWTPKDGWRPENKLV